jgi:signal transduction histidine kinase
MPGEEELPAPVQDLPPGTWVVLNISDTGLGIPPEDRERIFDKFAQAHLGQGRRRGIGLGLTFCRLAVEAHGGKIWVGDQTGDGSTFSFTLPAAPPPPTSEEPA